MSFNFEGYFEQITGSVDPRGQGYKPYQWQADLFEEWRSGKFRPIAVPTGLGKTSVMLVWLLALASQACEGVNHVSLPRRFVIVVDRRTVVDQSTEVAEGLLRWLDENPDHPVTVALAALSSKTHLGNRHVLSISTLRGERADNGDWKRDPARPAIIIGTVYKIGSRLLFWGDGDGRTMRSMHAGLLGQDVLLIHDEAHLSPAFGKLIKQIHAIQQRQPALKPFRCVELTATPSSKDSDALQLSDVDRSNPAVVKRLCADKILTLHRLGDEATPATKRAAIIEKALSYANTRKTVLIYVTSPDEASAIASELRKQAKPCEVRLLTGTLRGHERDALAQSVVFRQFLRKEGVDCTTYLVSTSAGSVGVDLDADVAIFDLCMLDNFIQRAGRINRSGGEGRQAPITLIYTRGDFANLKKGGASEIEHPRRHKTLELLQQLPAKGDGFDASPEALTNLVIHPEYQEASEPLPRMRKLDDYLLDTWSMTEPKPRIGPEVSPWLRGISDYEPPQTTLVWRDIPHCENSSSDERNRLDDWLSVYPVRIAEKSLTRTDQAQKFLESLAARLVDSTVTDKVPVISTHGEVAMISIGDLVKAPARLAEATVILPARWGGLSADGFPNPSSIEPVADVADQPGIRERWRISRAEGTWTATRINEFIELEADSFDRATSKLENMRGLRIVWLETSSYDADDEADITSARAYLVARRPTFPDDGESGSQAIRTQLLETHLHLVGASALAIGNALGLDQSLVDQLAKAGAAHDRGKDRSWWQRAAGNFTDQVLAKCYGRRAHWRLLRGYRHELGSLLDLCGDGVDDELILHLVASHHGRARPGFDTHAFDSHHTLIENEQASQASELRFDRLQRRYGWWGLAYLEALLKCADVMGSKEMDA